jgi:4-aminobutyrate aminotransferase-like enzyme/Ser/Thr protein kinase RdoA (MazF antagonist)
VGFNFLEQPELPAPQVSEAQAEQLLSTYYGLTARAESLGSNQDKNFLVYDAEDQLLGVLKVANPAFTATELAAQDAAAEAIAVSEPDLRVAVPLPNLAGELATVVPDLLDGTAHVRLLRYLAGQTLVGAGYLAPSVVAGMGELAARVSLALADFHHPGLDRALQWDLRYGHDVVHALVSHVAHPAERERLVTAADEAWARIAPLSDELPRQAVHLDLTDANVVANDARRPDGIIDFGDLSDTWAVSEVAVTLSSVLGHPGADPTSILPGIKAFHALRPLSAAEVDVIWPLLVLRTAVLIVSGAQQVVLDPDNDYLTNQSDDEVRMFEQATSVPMDLMTAVIRAELGLSDVADEAYVHGDGVLIPDLDPASVRTLDLSAVSEVYDTATEGVGAPAFQDALARSAVDDGASLVVTRYGEPNLTCAPLLSQTSPDVVATGVSLWPAESVTVTAPWSGDVVPADGEFTLRGAEYEVTVTGTATGGRVEAGAPLTTVAPDRWTTIAVRPVGAPVAPAFTTAELAPGWLALTRDPRPLLGLPELPDTTARDLLARRDQSFARVQEHYYADPPQIERGRRHYLMSTAGRVYLDMVNNVTVLGHAHPRVADTAARQLRRLNTNSRFNYEAVVEFSERLAATLPEPLDTVFLVNSGSEASDLAIRLAIAVSGHRDMVSVGEAYHGWTYATDAVSTSTADNPNALSTRPDWIHTVESPNSFRGTYRGADAARYAPDAVAKISEMVAAGRPPAGFICESVYGNAGGMALPDGYLRQVYAAVREAGGFAVADEVQVGYGRLGEWFWGFDQQQVVPDIVSIAKSTGNGYPLGAVITSRAIAEAFSSQGYFFSSTGGSPLSCAIGLTVLDVLRDEDLQGNARRVGGHLKAELTALREKHPIIGTVHGVGLYLGVEMVRDPETLEPATEETAAICDRMLELGVVIQPTGERQNILKTKPPLCLDVAGADFYVAALDRVLAEGW